jgi:hypothetical protein
LLYGAINQTSGNKRYVHKEHVRRRGGRLRCRHPVKPFKPSGPAVKPGQCQWLFDAELHVLQGNHSSERIPESFGLFLRVRLPCLGATRRCGNGAGSHTVLDGRRRRQTEFLPQVNGYVSGGGCPIIRRRRMKVAFNFRRIVKGEAPFDRIICLTLGMICQ